MAELPPVRGSQTRVDESWKFIVFVNLEKKIHGFRFVEWYIERYQCRSPMYLETACEAAGTDSTHEL
jgi:hypothetical protein